MAVDYACTCEHCGKKSYTSKRRAKAFARTFDRTLSVYRCGRHWHLGHLPRAVKSGEADRRALRKAESPTP